MTILAILGLLFGILLIVDSGFDRGVFATVWPSAGTVAVAVVRVVESLAGGFLILILGLQLSVC